MYRTASYACYLREEFLSCFFTLLFPKYTVSSKVMSIFVTEHNFCVNLL